MTVLSALQTPPGPTGDLSVHEVQNDALRFISNQTRTYGDIVRYRIRGFETTLVNHPAYARHVLQDCHRNYIKAGTPDFMLLRPMLGEGLLTSDGDSWLRQRRMAQPAFHRERIEAFGQSMVEAALALVREWDRRADTGQPVEIVGEMTRLTLTIVARALFGYTVEDDADEFGRAVEALNECMGHYDFSNAEVRSRFTRALKAIHVIVQRIILERRYQRGPADDFLSILLEARDPDTGAGLSEREIRDQVLTLLLAGHETTAKSLSWILYLISRHPAVEQAVQTELAQALGGPPAVSDLARLPYTWNVIQEGMRLYPPVWAMSRVCVAEDAIEGYRIPAGSLVTLSPFALHRHPALWSEPETFDPDRFRPETEAERPAFSYLPFGGGPRLCLGKHFAGMELHLVLAVLLQHYRFRLDPQAVVEPEALVTLRPRYGLPMRLQPREGARGR